MSALELRPSFKWLWYAGCGSAAFSVIMASLGGHKKDEDPYRIRVFDLASKYGLINAGAILFSSIYSKTIYPGICFLAGTVLFTGPIYASYFKKIEKTKILMPIGGLSIIAGWILLAFK